jgi:hypothetical protein
MGIRILLALDGSEESRVALELAERAAWPQGSRIDVLGIQAVSAHEERPDASRERVEAAVRRLQEAGLVSGAKLLEEDPLHAVLSEIGVLGVDLTVVGSDRAVAADDVEHSLAERLLDAAPGPILAARRAVPGPVLLVAHAPGVADRVVETLMRWQLPGIEDGLTVLGVSQPDLSIPIEAASGWLPEADRERGALESEAASWRERTLAGVARILDASGVTAQLRDAGPEDPLEAILGVAGQMGANTIVTAIGKRIEAEPPLSERQQEANRIAAELLRRAPCSVLAIPVDRGAELSQAAHS